VRAGAWGLAGAAALVVVFSLVPVSAQSVNYEGFVVGERAAGMGGAYTALADDGSAVFHNPAGLAQVRRSGLSMSANTYGYHESTVEGVLTGSGKSVDLERSGALAFPNSLVYVVPLGGEDPVQHTAAFSVLVPDYFEEDGVQSLLLPEAGVEFDIFVATTRQVYLVGPSYGLRVGRLYVGASLFARYLSYARERSTVLNTRIEDYASRLQQFEQVTADFVGLEGVLGVMVKPTPAWSFGLRVEVPPARLYGTARSFAARTVVKAPGGRDFAAAEAEVYQDVFRDLEDDVYVHRPWAFSAGASLTLAGGLVLSMDARLYLPLDPYRFIDGAPREATERYGELPLGLDSPPRTWDSTRPDPGGELVVNGALGAFVPVTEGYAVMAGLYSDLSPVASDKVGDVERVDQLGATFAVQREDEDATLTLGLGAIYGWGEAFGLRFDGGQVAPSQPDVTRWTAMVFLAGSTPFGGDAEEVEAE